MEKRFVIIGIFAQKSHSTYYFIVQFQRQSENITGVYLQRDHASGLCFLATQKTEAEMPQVQGQPRLFNEILSQNTNIKRGGHRDQGRTTTLHAEDHKFQSKLKKKIIYNWNGREPLVNVQLQLSS